MNMAAKFWETRGKKTSFLNGNTFLARQGEKKKKGNMRKSHYGSCLGMVVQRVNESKKQRKRVVCVSKFVFPLVYMSRLGRTKDDGTG